MYRFINLLEQRLYIFSQHHSPNYILKDIRKKLKSLCFESIKANNLYLTSPMFANIYLMIFKSVFVLFKMFNLSQFIFHMTFYKSHPYFQKDEARNKARVSDGIIGNRKVEMTLHWSKVVVFCIFLNQINLEQFGTTFYRIRN